ncbi:neutral zinc metallopeptidase [uncultured Cohaesibacter sp.]|uniref:KPN_02809 family neutral zinc metallopeptidase n=1 Tax=uncultured Cohaesibacter sp. TaxID=1002546 RepID=UPI002930AC34|nr:neutral zinc metallopeptidase [uncultured Cohaesibacter sp.]
MRWRGRRQSSNVEDRRGQSSGGYSRSGMRLPIGRSGGKSGPSLLVLIVIGGVLWMMGVSPNEIISMLLGGGGTYSTQTQSVQNSATPRSAAEEELASFVKVVLAETEDVWGAIFEKAGGSYSEPKMVMFSNQVQSACGTASSASGPFYCPGDKKVYIDLSFYKELKTRFDAPGDFAQAYVVAHEVGHHVQNLLGILPKYNQMRKSLSEVEANKLSIRVELQADCYAGVWAHYTDQKGLLERGDLGEALNAATQIGDDTLQKRTQGYVVPDSFNHGTSAQRKRWFSKGYENGNLKACDTFSVKSL